MERETGRSRTCSLWAREGSSLHEKKKTSVFRTTEDRIKESEKSVEKVEGIGNVPFRGSRISQKGEIIEKA